MILYHTSTVEIQRPELSYSRPRLDFGKGFYVTTLQEQAKRLAEQLNLSDLQAISLFYKSRVYRVLSDKSSLLITQPEMYIVDELVEELKYEGA